MSSRSVVPRAIVEYLTPDGRSPFHDWLKGLRDLRAVGAVRQRLNRVRLGNLGT